MFPLSRGRSLSGRQRLSGGDEESREVAVGHSDAFLLVSNAPLREPDWRKLRKVRYYTSISGPCQSPSLWKITFPFVFPSESPRTVVHLRPGVFPDRPSFEGSPASRHPLLLPTFRKDLLSVGLWITLSLNFIALESFPHGLHASFSYPACRNEVKIAVLAAPRPPLLLTFLPFPHARLLATVPRSSPQNDRKRTKDL